MQLGGWGALKALPEPGRQTTLVHFLSENAMQLGVLGRCKLPQFQCS